jgi:hypothetical protein
VCADLASQLSTSEARASSNRDFARRLDAQPDPLSSNPANDDACRTLNLNSLADL